MTLQSAAASLRSPRVITPLVVFSCNFYLPTVGVGTENAPNLAAQGALIAISLIGGVFALADRRVRQLVLRAPLVFAFVLAGWMAVSALQTSEPLDGAVRGLWFAAASLVVAWTVVSERWPTALLILAAPIAAFIFIGVAAKPFADVEFQGSEFFNERLFPWPRFRGLSANHTIIGLGGALVCSIAFSVGKKWPPGISGLILSCGALGVLASHSRAAIGALALGLLLEVCRSRRHLLTPIIAGGLVLSSLWLLSGGSTAILDRSDEQDDLDATTAAETDLLTGRGEVWGEAMDFAGRNPLIGSGVGTFADHTALQFEQGVRLWDPVHAHNVVLELLVDQGLVGVFNLFAMAVSLVLLRAHLRPGSVGILAIVGAHSMVEGLFYGAPTAGWLLVVAVLAATAVSDSSEVGVEAGDPPDSGERHAESSHSDHREAQSGAAESRR